jgi:hypothetical protein
MHDVLKLHFRHNRLGQKWLKVNYEGILDNELFIYASHSMLSQVIILTQVKVILSNHFVICTVFNKSCDVKERLTYVCKVGRKTNMNQIMMPLIP